MNPMIEKVLAFHIKYGQHHPDAPAEMPASIASLRKKLVLEEATELVLAVDRGELDEQLDAIVDTIYVAIGTAVSLGMAHVLEEAFDRVHHANMQKVLTPSRQVSKRDSAHDIVKPEGWRKPDLADLVVKP